LRFRPLDSDLGGKNAIKGDLNRESRCKGVTTGCSLSDEWVDIAMTDKQAVIDALSRLPEDVTLDEITEELCIMAAVRRGRADSAAGRMKTHE